MQNIPLIGRVEEQEMLKKALASPKAEMISVIGRRRVGKTFLIQSAYKDKIDFEITGIQYATRTQQLRNFNIQLSKFFKNSDLISEPRDWIEAFHFLTQLLEKKKKRGKMVVFQIARMGGSSGTPPACPDRHCE